jgi:hypothetical protein
MFQKTGYHLEKTENEKNSTLKKVALMNKYQNNAIEKSRKPFKNSNFSSENRTEYVYLKANEINHLFLK